MASSESVFLVAIEVPKSMAITSLALGRTVENRSISRRFHQIQFRHMTTSFGMRDAGARRFES